MYIMVSVVACPVMYLIVSTIMYHFSVLQNVGLTIHCC